MTDLAHQTAQELVRLIPPSATPDFFEDYGLTLTAQQAQAVTMELLALTTYWITCAIRVSIPRNPLAGGCTKPFISKSGNNGPANSG